MCSFPGRKEGSSSFCVRITPTGLPQHGVSDSDAVPAMRGAAGRSDNREGPCGVQSAQGILEAHLKERMEVGLGVKNQSQGQKTIEAGVENGMGTEEREEGRGGKHGEGPGL